MNTHADPAGSAIVFRNGLVLTMDDRRTVLNPR